MFSTDSSQAAIVDCADPISTSLKRSAKESALETNVLPYQNNITRREVREAWRGWTQALVDISQTYKNEGFEAAEELAGAVIDGAYAYQLGAVAFKPTWASGDTSFRTDREGAISYFVGGNDDYDDLGYAIGNVPNKQGKRSPWADAWTENAVIRIDGDTATSMGWMYTEDEKGNVGYVDKTWTYQKGDDGVLRIVVHHSSKPYA